MTNGEKILSITGLFDLPTLLEQTAEEAAELTQAALKLSRVRRGQNPTPVTYEQARDHLVEELADIKLCIEVLETGWPQFKCDSMQIKQKKLDRWYGRLTKYLAERREVEK